MSNYKYLLIIVFSFSQVLNAATQLGESVGTTNRTESPRLGGFEVQYGSTALPEYRLQNGANVSGRGHTLKVGLEFFAFKSLGKLAFGLGSGLIRQPNVEVQADTYATIEALPAEVSVSYRFDFIRGQLLVPFAKVSAASIWSRETSQTGGARPDSNRDNYWTWSAGLQLNLSRIEERAALTMDKTYGINDTYLIISYHKTQPLQGGSRQFSGDALSAGLRFEI